MSVKAMTWVFDHSPYEGNYRLVHLVIADVVNDAYHNQCWLHVGDMAQRANCSIRTVKSITAKMVADGYLKKVQQGGGRGNPTVYEMMMPKNGAVVAPLSNGATVQPTPTNGATSESSPIYNQINSKEKPSQLRCTPGDAAAAYTAHSNGEDWYFVKIDGTRIWHSKNDDPQHYFELDGTRPAVD